MEKIELRKAMDLIKTVELNECHIITEQDIARKAGVSENQLNAYLNGDDKLPDDFVSSLKAAYGIKTVHVSFNQTEHVIIPSDEDETESKDAG